MKLAFTTLVVIFLMTITFFVPLYAGDEAVKTVEITGFGEGDWEIPHLPTDVRSALRSIVQAMNSDSGQYFYLEITPYTDGTDWQSVPHKVGEVLDWPLGEKRAQSANLLLISFGLKDAGRVIVNPPIDLTESGPEYRKVGVELKKKEAEAPDKTQTVIRVPPETVHVAISVDNANDEKQDILQKPQIDVAAGLLVGGPHPNTAYWPVSGVRPMVQVGLGWDKWVLYTSLAGGLHDASSSFYAALWGRLYVVASLGIDAGILTDWVRTNPAGENLRYDGYWGFLLGVSYTPHLLQRRIALSAHWTPLMHTAKEVDEAKDKFHLMTTFKF